MTKRKITKEIETEEIETEATEIEEAGTASAVPPITVGNPAAAASFAIDQSHMEEFASVEEKSDNAECEKPAKGIFFTVLPEPVKPWRNRKFYFLLEIKDHEPYIVAPSIAKLKKDEDVIRPILIARYVTMAGDEGLWPLKLDRPDATTASPWNKTALGILETASAGCWVRMWRGKGHYKYTVSPKTFEQTPPKFSDRPFDDLIKFAFKDRIIDSLDHEIWKALDEGSDK